MRSKLIAVLAIAFASAYYGCKSDTNNSNTGNTGTPATTTSTTTYNENKGSEMPDLSGWPEASRKAASEMQAKYGKPDGVTPDMLIWNNNGIWLQTIVYKKEMKHDFPMPHTDVVEQWINYSVPLDKYDDLAKYDGSVTVNRTNGTISARCDKEEMNILALNLSHDVATGNKNIQQARKEYGKNVMAFKNNEKPAYTQKLNFTADKSAPDFDKPLDMKSMPGDEMSSR